MKPMLAHKYSESKIRYPVYIQPKLNGIRATHIRGIFQSRDENNWDEAVLPHLFTQLKGFQIPTDGELYRHEMSLQEINSRVAVKRTKAHDKVHVIQYHIFDLIIDSPFHIRAKAMAQLRNARRFNDAIQFVDTYLVHSQNEADYYYRRFRDVGFEGMMYRDPHAPYGFEWNCGNKENRWNCLLKRKEMQDDVATIIGFNEGEGQFVGALGSFELQYKNGAIFSAGSGLTPEQRFLYWQHQEQLLGLDVNFSYEMLSDGGVPLKPIIDKVQYVDGIF